MRFTIRQSVFETNSSSTHAICIAPEYVDNFPDSVTFREEDFGWGGEKTNSLQTKLNYLYAMIGHCEDDSIKDKIVNILNKHNIKTIFRGCAGCIDHGDETDMIIKVLADNEELLLRYLFGNSYLVTGNDNDDWYREVMQENKEFFENYDIFEKWN